MINQDINWSKHATARVDDWQGKGGKKGGTQTQQSDADHVSVPLANQAHLENPFSSDGQLEHSVL